MKRRDFIGTTLAAGLFGALPSATVPDVPKTGFTPSAFEEIPLKIAGMSLEELRDDYRYRLFKLYLPFWDKGGFDEERGGFMCELNDDGTIHDDEKYIWYQGRALWVYSFLYNNFGKIPRYLEIAGKTRNFMVKYMHAGNGIWHESVNHVGSLRQSGGQGSSTDIYGALFAAAGFVEYYKAVGNEEDLELAKTSIWTSIQRYNDPDYTGITLKDYPNKGLRAQGHSFMLVWTITQLLSFHDDSKLDELVREHADLIMNKFWNPDYGISNEILEHDYTRISGTECSMVPGHTLETQWMVMFEAMRQRNGTMFYILKTRIRRILEMCWDYVFDGFCDTGYNVFGTSEYPPGPVYEEKTMWAHSEILIACLLILEYTGDVWAKEWFERAWAYTIRTMTTDYGVWRQAVDRFGENKKREGISEYRKCNFHQPRALMYNLLSLDRMIKNNGKLTPFPL